MITSPANSPFTIMSRRAGLDPHLLRLAFRFTLHYLTGNNKNKEHFDNCILSNFYLEEIVNFLPERMAANPALAHLAGEMNLPADPGQANDVAIGWIQEHHPNTILRRYHLAAYKRTVMAGNELEMQYGDMYLVDVVLQHLAKEFAGYQAATRYCRPCRLEPWAALTRNLAVHCY